MACETWGVRMTQLVVTGRVLLAGLLIAVAGCQSTPPQTLEEMRTDQAQKLALQCYAKHEGERMVAGGAEVYRACSRWARTVLRAHAQRMAVATAPVDDTAASED